MNTIKEVWHYREMIAGLVRRDLRGRYKASVLGFLWTFINPLLQLLVYTMVFSIILRSNIEQYYIHLFVALELTFSSRPFSIRKASRSKFFPYMGGCPLLKIQHV